MVASRVQRNARGQIDVRALDAAMTLDTTLGPADVREITGRLKRYGLSQALRDDAHRKGGAFASPRMGESKNGRTPASPVSSPDAPTPRDARPSYSATSAMLRAAAARDDPLGYDRDRRPFDASSSSSSSSRSSSSFLEDAVPSTHPRTARVKQKAELELLLSATGRVARRGVIRKATIDVLATPKVVPSELIERLARERDAATDATRRRHLERWTLRQREEMRRWRADRDATRREVEEEEVALERERRRYVRELNRYVRSKARQDVDVFVTRREIASERAHRARRRAFGRKDKEDRLARYAGEGGSELALVLRQGAPEECKGEEEEEEEG